MSGDYKFGRSFVLRIEANQDKNGANVDADGNSWVEIKSPFTCEFTISRNNLSATNNATFVIYNLGPDNRNRIYKDVYDTNNLKAVQFFAGYAEKAGDLLPRCFNGTVKLAYSQRNGPDFRTMIEAFDGYNSFGVPSVSVSIPAGTKPSDQILAVSQELSKKIGSTIPVSMGDKFSDIPKRALAIMAAPGDALEQITGGNAYVDNQAIYALDHADCLDGDVRLIDFNNGLIGTPRKSETMVEIDMLFEPRIKPSQWIELKSLSDPRFDGLYKVTAITHKGVISGAVGGDCVTSLTLVLVKGFSVVYDKATQQYQVKGPGIE